VIRGPNLTPRARYAFCSNMGQWADTDHVAGSPGARTLASIGDSGALMLEGKAVLSESSASVGRPAWGI